MKIADVARTPVDHLKILKQAANNWYDNMGLATWSGNRACRRRWRKDGVSSGKPASGSGVDG